MKPPPPIGTITQSIRAIVDELEPGCSLARNHDRIVIRMDRRKPLLRNHPVGQRAGFGHRLAKEDDFCAVAFGVPDLVEGRMHRHDNSGRDAEPCGVIGHSLRVIARGNRDHASFPRRVVERKQLQKSAPLFEAARGLHVLVLDGDARTRKRRELRRFDGGCPENRVLQAAGRQPYFRQPNQRLLDTVVSL